MKKKRNNLALTPEQALEFLESFRKLQAGLDEPTKAISLRVPGNILNAYKNLAISQNMPYQRMMIQALREYLSKR